MPQIIEPPARDTEESASTATQHDTRTYHVRQHGGRPIPLSPLMDPQRIAQKNRHKLRKAAPLPMASCSEFQRKLYNNPYAHALATPVRDCPVTDSLLPRFFFIPFDPKPHPDAPTEWHLLPSTLFAQSSPRTPNDAAVRSPQMYVSGRAALLRFMKARQKGTRRVEKWKDLNTAVIKWLAKVKVTHLHLNPDIDDLVLNLLQESVVSALKWPLQRPNAGYIETADKGIDAIDEIDDVACILYVDSPKSPEVEDLERQVQLCLTKCDGFVNTIDRWQNVLIGGGKEIMREWAAETEAPQLVPRLSAHYSLPRLRFPTVAYRGRKVPVYSLQDLLGVDRTRRLLEGTRFGDAKYLVIKESTQGSYKGQEQLLRLQGYLQ